MANDVFSFIGVADAYVDILDDNGTRTGLVLEGNCTEFTPKPDSETKEQTGNGLNNFGDVIASVVIPKPMKATIKFNQLSQKLFAANFFGTTTALSQSAATSAQTLTVTAIADRFVELGKYMVTVSTVTANSETLEEDVDYQLNGRLGMIKLLSSSTKAADGDELTITCTWAQVAGSSMAAMTKSNVRIRVKLDGQNYADGRRFVSEIYQMRLAPSGNFSLIGTDFAEVTFEGTLERPAGYDEPMKHTWLN